MTSHANSPSSVTFRLAPAIIGTMWAGVVLGGVLIIGPMAIPGEGAEVAYVIGAVFAVVFGVSAILGHRYHVTYDPEARTLTTATVGRRVADLTRPVRLTAAGNVGHGYHLRTDDAGKVGLSSALVSAEGYDVHDLAAELHEVAPALEVAPDLATALAEHARSATPLHERKRSAATRYLLQLSLLVTAVVAGPQLLRLLFGG